MSTSLKSKMNEWAQRFSLSFKGIAVATMIVGNASPAYTQQIERTDDFSEFWPQLRNAVLTENLDALDQLSLSRSGIPFGYDSLDPNETCHRQVLEAYLKAKLDFFYSRPGGTSYREVLERTVELDLDSHPDVYVNGIGEYSLGLKLRFARNHIDGAWDLVDMLDDIDRVFSFSESAGGPANC